jgi:hypothetical protein
VQRRENTQEKQLLKKLQVIREVDKQEGSKNRQA